MKFFRLLSEEEIRRRYGPRPRYHTPVGSFFREQEELSNAARGLLVEVLVKLAGLLRRAS